MPKVRLLVPWGEHAAGAEVDVSDEDFADLRADGKASSIEEEQKAAEAASEGNYSSRTSRTDAGEAKAEDAKPPAARDRDKK
jgi:hypothetical protein